MLKIREMLVIRQHAGYKGSDESLKTRTIQLMNLCLKIIKAIIDRNHELV